MQFKSHGKTAQKISQRGLARLTSTTVQSCMLEATVKFLPEADTSYECSIQETCNGLVLIECTLHCCRGDLCNRAFRLELGAVILVSSLLTSLNAMYFIFTNEL